MSVRLTCPSRLHTFRLDSKHFWRKLRCPWCKVLVDPTRVQRVIKRLLRPFSKAATVIPSNTRLGRSSPQPQLVIEVSNKPRFANVKSQIDKLAKQAWQTEESVGAEFLLNPATLLIGPPEKTIETVLHHVRRIAPGFSVPYRVLRVETGPLIDAAGQFKVSDGWVSVKIASHLLMKPKAIRAILAHEVCHYILENSGIREKDYDQTERLTDLCMFVCGLGKIFLDGYKREGTENEYRQGHRLGYLSDAEYEFAAEYVLEMRRTNSLQLPTRAEELERKFTVRLNDSQARDRLLKHARTRYPEKSDSQLYELIMEQLERDRR